MTDTPRPTRAPASPVLHRRRPFVPLAPAVVTWLHRLSLVWSVLAVVAIEVAGRTRLLDHRPGQASYEVTARPVFVVLFAVGAIAAWRWVYSGGLLAAFTAMALLAWHVHQLEPLAAALVAVAFGVPGAAWLLIGLQGRNRVRALVGVGAAVVVAVGGFAGGSTTWNRLFGPTHPASAATRPDGTVVEWIWTGGVTSTSATVVISRDGPGPHDALVREVGTAEPVRVRGEADGRVVRFTVNGLTPATPYEVEIVGADEPPGSGITEASFRTFPEGRAAVTIAVGSCMRTGSNGAVFDAIGSLRPDLFVVDGDLHYGNVERDDPDEFRDVLDLVLSRPGPSQLFRSVPIAYVWDDHDYGSNDADSESPSRPAAMEVYREYVPSYLDGGPQDPINQVFDVGDVRVIMTDSRSERSPSAQLDDEDKTMLGDRQLAWLETELLRAHRERALTIWVNPLPWIGAEAPGADDWSGYSTERARIAEFIDVNEIDRLVMVSGDAHMVAIDDGSHSGYATSGRPAFPVLQAAALDRPGALKGGPYSEGAVPGGGQFGVVEVAFEGDEMVVRLTGRDWTGAVLLEHEARFTVPTTP